MEVQYHPSSHEYKTEILRLLKSGVCDKACSPKYLTQLKLGNLLSWLDGHPLMDADDVHCVQEK